MDVSNLVQTEHVLLKCTAELYRPLAPWRNGVRNLDLKQLQTYYRTFVALFLFFSSFATKGISLHFSSLSTRFSSRGMKIIERAEALLVNPFTLLHSACSVLQDLWLL